MVVVQRALIETGLRHLAPGGRLVYATCTFTREENEGVVEAVLRDHSQLRTVQPEIDAALLDSRGFFFVTPQRHGTDSFFGCVFERRL